MCLNVGTLATVYLKPVHTVFRSARPRRLAESAALQRHTLPTVVAAQAARRRAELERSPLDTAAAIMNGNSNGHSGALAAGGSSAPVAIGSAGAGNLAAAVSEADMYFSGVGRESAFGGSPVVGAPDDAARYIVTQNAPVEMVGSPHGAEGGDLLL